MSLYSRLPDLRPLPSPELYDEAHIVADEVMGPQGTWNEVTAEFASLRTDKELRPHFLTAAQYGFMLRDEELSDETFSDEAPKFLVGRAFAQGFSQQVAPSQLLYSKKYSLEKGLAMMNWHYASQKFPQLTSEDNKQEMKERIALFNSQYLAALGDYGLSRVGAASNALVTKWSQEAYPADARLASAFRIGHGAMIICAMHYQLGTNDRLINIASEQVNLDVEAAAIFASGTSEDS